MHRGLKFGGVQDTNVHIGVGAGKRLVLEDASSEIFLQATGVRDANILADALQLAHVQGHQGIQTLIFLTLVELASGLDRFRGRGLLVGC